MIIVVITNPKVKNMKSTAWQFAIAAPTHLVESDEALLVEELEALLLRGLLVDLVHLGRALGKELGGEVQKAVPRVPDHDHGDDVLVGGTLNWWNLQINKLT